ncbi:hypothetical protein GUJ93_ZPchr0007g3158 [Zizania palustris]|uniref:Uncharacterized protein n=1 Tax=Zizania palustris TaxID=103762 RepID=A0A8J5TIW5_ZIZPA|nr:hypothetical protein GUJ93_ZPchr0007g3158 [Zizania palustris]
MARTHGLSSFHREPTTTTKSSGEYFLEGTAHDCHLPSGVRFRRALLGIQTAPIPPTSAAGHRPTDWRAAGRQGNQTHSYVDELAASITR